MTIHSDKASAHREHQRAYAAQLLLDFLFFFWRRCGASAAVLDSGLPSPSQLRLLISEKHPLLTGFLVTSAVFTLGLIDNALPPFFMGRCAG